MAKKKQTTPEKQIDLRKLNPEERIKSLCGTVVERTFEFETKEIDKESRTVWLSISSEAPYERYWGVEILDHGKKSIDTARLKAGAPLLVGHDTDDQVGIIESFEVTQEKKLRVLARFSRSARAEEIFNDVLDGIRKSTSVGYVINDLRLEKQEGDTPTYRVTSWTPFEGSLVSVPADYTVGVGRSSENKNNNEDTMPQENTKGAEDTAAREAEILKKAKEKAEAEAKAIREKELQRVQELTALGEQYADHEGRKVASDIIRDPQGTVDQFRAKMLEKLSTKSKIATAEPVKSEHTRIEIVPRLGSMTSFKGVKLSNGDEIKPEEQAHRSAMWASAEIFGNAKAKRWCEEHGVYSRIMHSDNLTTGGALVPPEFEQAIIDLRDNYGIARQLCKVRTMGSDVLNIPKRTGGLTAYYMQDSSDTAVTASDKAWGNVELKAKKLAGLGVISADTVEDAMIDAVNDLAMELAWVFAKAEDNAWIDGDGTSTYGGIQGLRTLFAATAYASRVTATSGDDTFTEVLASDLNLVMGSIAAYAKPGAVWLCSETAKSIVFDGIMSTAGGNTTVTLGGKIVPSYLGYPIVTTEAMPAGASTDYSNTAMLFFGNFGLSSSLGDRRGISVQILREAYATKGQIGVLGTQRYDIVNHDLGTTGVTGPVAAYYGN